jgi:ubiquinone/menaquinone biosynthesis C-methylase UbiE
VKAYYDRRAPEYDDWYLGAGLHLDRDRPDWDQEVAQLCKTIAELPPARTLDVACGTGFLTLHLRGEVVGLDQSERMLAIARVQAPNATLVRGDALALPFPNGSFERVVTGHFYGHLEEEERLAFLQEVRRVAPELVVVDTALQPDVEPEAWEERVLGDGSRWAVYKRYFTGDGLTRELGGGEVLHWGNWFVVVRSPS